MIVLGIESSCDETAAALVRLTHNEPGVKGVVLAEEVLSQLEEHRPFGGHCARSRGTFASRPPRYPNRAGHVGC